MEKLSTIQKREKLNDVYIAETSGVGGAAHKYVIAKHTENPDFPQEIIAEIQFQQGPRYDEHSVDGVTNEDLLEIVRDRLKGFQSGDLATRETAIALTHIEEALMWLNHRIDDRIERNVLGTYNK